MRVDEHSCQESLSHDDAAIRQTKRSVAYADEGKSYGRMHLVRIRL